MFQGFYLTTKDCWGKRVAPDEWQGEIPKDTPIVLTYFDEYSMEFSDGTPIKFGSRTFILSRPCPIVAACSCDICGRIVPTTDLKMHKKEDINCKRIAGLE